MPNTYRRYTYRRSLQQFTTSGTHLQTTPANKKSRHESISVQKARWGEELRPLIELSGVHVQLGRQNVKTQREFENTLHRIARHVRERVGQYEALYLHFVENIKPQHGPHIAKHEETLQAALRAIKDLPTHPTDPEMVHRVLRRVSAAADTIIFLQQTEIELLRRSIGGSAALNSDTDGAAAPATPLSPAELQMLRDEVREMTIRQEPKAPIERYLGRKVHGEAAAFFKTHYAAYVMPGQEVIFAPDLAAIDRRLLDALRNECRTQANPMPIGTIEDRTTARLADRFSDGPGTQRAIRAAAARRSRTETDHALIA